MAMLDEIIKHNGKNNFQTPHVKKDCMEKFANCIIMNINASSSIKEGPRNFMVDTDGPSYKKKAAVSAQNTETTPTPAIKESNNNTITKEPRDMTYV